MDFWGSLGFFLFIVLIMFTCGWCCTSKKRGAILSTPVVVTSATHTAPGGYPTTQVIGGYPPTQLAPGVYQTNTYVTPYPPASGMASQMPMPMPMPAGGQPPPPGMQPFVSGTYPPQQTNASNANPPSYDAAMSVAAPTSTSTYEKQSPYNPNY